MRNLFLALLLLNLLVLAWQAWVAPDPEASPAAPTVPELGLYGVAPPPAATAAPTARPGPRPSLAPPADNAPGGRTQACLRVGPFGTPAGASEFASALADRGLPVAPVEVPARTWVGNWVRVTGFRSAAEAEGARRRLVAGGLTDALLVQDGEAPVISLGVFRDRERADRILGAARRLGFPATRTDRYRPGVEHWVLVSADRDQALAANALARGPQILRTEAAGCGPLDAAAAPASAAGATGVAPGQIQ